MNDVIATDRLFHYALASSDGIAPEILREGLRPLSDFRDSERWQRIERELPGYFEKLYADWAEQVIGSPYPGRSGVFLSPVDFRRLPGTLLHDRARLVVPLENIDVQWACLTYKGDGPRTCLPVTPATLAEAAARWPQERVRRWFGVDTSRLFFHVPQVVVYQPGPVPVRAEE